MWTVEPGKSAGVLTVRGKYARSTSWEQRALLSADWHWDNPRCRRDLLRRHLDEAKKTGAIVCAFGDLFCAMQGRYDSRRIRDETRPEHQTATYLDSLVEGLADWLKPWYDVPMIWSPGNHETKVRKHEETDLLARTAGLINARGGHITLGTYRGWILWRWSRDAGGRATTTMAYHHGYGGGGPVTKGTIQTARRATYLGDADIIVTGHVHEAWCLETIQEVVTPQGKRKTRVVTHISTPGYKEEADAEGWHVERGAPPKPLGAWWLTWRAHTARSTRDQHVGYTVGRTWQG